MTKKPAGFMSYVHFDDEHENGRLSDLRKRLSGEVRVHTGEEFPIFQDQNDIQWGQPWKDRIEGALDSVTFLIPIITPAFFKSRPCTDEFHRFLDRERQLGRNDLILPVYYVECPLLNDEKKRNADALAKAVADRQYVDWRELRFEPLTSPSAGRLLAKMAKQIRDALEREQPAAARRRSAAKPRRKKAVPNAAATPSEGEGASPQASEAARGPAGKTELTPLIVDGRHTGHHSNLAEALAAAKPGDRILVRPGVYKEGVVVDRAVEILGDGELSEIVIEAMGKNAILFRANMGRIANLTLRQAEGGNFYCVDIAQGRLDLEGCDISSQSNACVAIRGGADPRLRRNRIHDGKSAGVFVYENSQGTLEDNDIFANALSGVEIKQGSNPTLRKNRIHDGKSAGVIVYENGQGTLEDNDIFANALSGVEIRQGGNPMLRKNRIHDGKSSGAYIHDNGQGTLEDNDIFANALAGVAIKEGGNPTLRQNRISKNGAAAVHVWDGGQGVFENNDLRGNAKGAWSIAADCTDKVKRTGNQE
jgi:F-box protein 11